MAGQTFLSVVIIKMKVTLKLFATLRDYLPETSDGKSCLMDIDENTSVELVLETLQVPVKPSFIILVNAVHADKDRVLRDGDVIAVFPPLAGG